MAGECMHTANSFLNNFIKMVNFNHFSDNST
jgi:hypothetical protein